MDAAAIQRELQHLRNRMSATEGDLYSYRVITDNRLSTTENLVNRNSVAIGHNTQGLHDLQQAVTSNGRDLAAVQTTMATIEEKQDQMLSILTNPQPIPQPNPQPIPQAPTTPVQQPPPTEEHEEFATTRQSTPLPPLTTPEQQQPPTEESEDYPTTRRSTPRRSTSRRTTSRRTTSRRDTNRLLRTRQSGRTLRSSRVRSSNPPDRIKYESRGDPVVHFKTVSGKPKKCYHNKKASECDCEAQYADIIEENNKWKIKNIFVRRTSTPSWQQRKGDIRVRDERLRQGRLEPPPPTIPYKTYRANVPTVFKTCIEGSSNSLKCVSCNKRCIKCRCEGKLWIVIDNVGGRWEALRMYVMQ